MKDTSKCKEWERRRRDRLNDAFKSLAQLLPNHDPAKNQAKIDILEAATQFVKELRLSNSRLLNNHSELDEKSTAINKLQDEVNKLLLRVKQLTTLLKQAKITIPTGPSIRMPGSRKLKWSRKLTPENVENSLQRKDGSVTVVNGKKKRKDSGDPNTTNTTPVNIASGIQVTTPLKETNTTEKQINSVNSASSSASEGSPTNDHVLGSAARPIPVPFSLPTTIIVASCPLPQTVLPPVTFTLGPHKILPKPLLNDPLQKIPILPLRKAIPKVKKKRKRLTNKEKAEKAAAAAAAAAAVASQSAVDYKKSESVQTSVSSNANATVATASLINAEPVQSCDMGTVEGAIQQERVNQESQPEEYFYPDVAHNVEVTTSEVDSNPAEPKSQPENQKTPASDDVVIISESVSSEPEQMLVVEPVSTKRPIVVVDLSESKSNGQDAESIEKLSEYSMSNQSSAACRTSANIVSVPEAVVTAVNQVSIPTSSSEVVEMEVAENDAVNSDKISECIARSIDLIDPPEGELMELSAEWGDTHSPKSPISPTQMFLSMFPLLPRESIVSSTEAHSSTSKFPSVRSSFFIDAMLPEENSVSSPSQSHSIISAASNCLAMTPLHFSGSLSIPGGLNSFPSSTAGGMSISSLTDSITIPRSEPSFHNLDTHFLSMTSSLPPPPLSSSTMNSSVPLPSSSSAAAVPSTKAASSSSSRFLQTSSSHSHRDFSKESQNIFSTATFANASNMEVPQPPTHHVEVPVSVTSNSHQKKAVQPSPSGQNQHFQVASIANSSSQRQPSKAQQHSYSQAQTMNNTPVVTSHPSHEFVQCQSHHPAYSNPYASTENTQQNIPYLVGNIVPVFSDHQPNTQLPGNETHNHGRQTHQGNNKRQQHQLYRPAVSQVQQFNHNQNRVQSGRQEQQKAAVYSSSVPAPINLPEIVSRSKNTENSIHINQRSFSGMVPIPTTSATQSQHVGPTLVQTQPHIIHTHNPTKSTGQKRQYPNSDDLQQTTHFHHHPHNQQTTNSVDPQGHPHPQKSQSQHRSAHSQAQAHQHQQGHSNHMQNSSSSNNRQQHGQVSNNVSKSNHGNQPVSSATGSSVQVQGHVHGQTHVQHHPQMHNMFNMDFMQPLGPVSVPEISFSNRANIPQNPTAPLLPEFANGAPYYAQQIHSPRNAAQRSVPFYLPDTPQPETPINFITTEVDSSHHGQSSSRNHSHHKNNFHQPQTPSYSSIQNQSSQHSNNSNKNNYPFNNSNQTQIQVSSGNKQCHPSTYHGQNSQSNSAITAIGQPSESHSHNAIVFPGQVHNNSVAVNPHPPQTSNSTINMNTQIQRSSQVHHHTQKSKQPPSQNNYAQQQQQQNKHVVHSSSSNNTNSNNNTASSTNNHQNQNSCPTNSNNSNSNSSSQSQAHRPVNWMTDTPTPYNRKASNPFSVSKLVGNTNTSANTGTNNSGNSSVNNNYCAEALIRKNTAPPVAPDWTDFHFAPTSGSGMLQRPPPPPSFVGNLGYPAQTDHSGPSYSSNFHHHSPHYPAPNPTNFAHFDGSQHQIHHQGPATIHHPPHVHHGTTSVSNFNLSSIFPEMNDKRNLNVNPPSGNGNNCNFFGGKQ